MTIGTDIAILALWLVPCVCAIVKHMTPLSFLATTLIATALTYHIAG
jgi:hypothetical protein